MRTRKRAERDFLEHLWKTQYHFEAMVLGGIIVTAEVSYLNRLHDSNFLDKWHAELFRGLVMADISGIPFQDTARLLVFLRDRLKDTTEQKTGERWLMRMMRMLYRPAHPRRLPSYIDSLHTYSARRQMYDNAINLLHMMRDPLVSTDDWNRSVQEINRAMEVIRAKTEPGDMR